MAAAISSATTSAGGAIVAWSDARRGQTDIAAQHVLANGTIASGWSFNGLPVCVAAKSQSETALVATSQGAIIVWTDFRLDTFGDMYAQRALYGGGIGAPEFGWGIRRFTVRRSRLRDGRFRPCRALREEQVAAQ